MIEIVVWVIYSAVSVFMTVFPILVGGLEIPQCFYPLVGNYWLYGQGAMQFLLYLSFLPFCIDTYMYYYTETQNTLPKWLFRTSLISTTIFVITSAGWGILGIYNHTRCYYDGLVTRSLIGLGVLDLILYIPATIILIGLITIDCTG